LRLWLDDETVVVSGRILTVPPHVELERAMTDREQEQLLATATDRFERRLAEECAGLRADIGALRVEMVQQDAATRVEMTEQFAAARIHSEARHQELLKWALVFWVGQAAAVAGIFSAFT
jgi:hypothetical protein